MEFHVCTPPPSNSHSAMLGEIKCVCGSPVAGPGPVSDGNLGSSVTVIICAQCLQ